MSFLPNSTAGIKAPLAVFTVFTVCFQLSVIGLSAKHETLSHPLKHALQADT